MEQSQCKKCKKNFAKKGRSSCEECLEKQRHSTAVRRKNLKSNGFCNQCGKNPTEAYYCKECLEKQKFERKISKKSGNCIHCNKASLQGKTTCAECTARSRKADKKMRMKRREEGLCVTCGVGEVVTPHVKCENCRTSQAINSRNKIKNFNDSGLCIICGSEPLNNNRFCEVCYLKKTATKRLGASNKWDLLKELLAKQNYICPYTGIKLSLGTNAALDHIVPTSIGGTNSIANVQWTLKEANEMKWHYDEEKFLKLVKQIYEFKNLGNLK